MSELTVKKGDKIIFKYSFTMKEGKVLEVIGDYLKVSSPGMKKQLIHISEVKAVKERKKSWWEK